MKIMMNIKMQQSSEGPDDIRSYYKIRDIAQVKPCLGMSRPWPSDNLPQQRGHGVSFARQRKLEVDVACKLGKVCEAESRRVAVG